MNKFLLVTMGLIIGLFLSIGGSVLAKGEWSGWWKLKEGGKIQRFYDQENKLVCWIWSGYSTTESGLSCQPSLELDNPIFGATK